MKFPIGIQSFDQIITDGYVYVDKTDLIYPLTHEGKIYFLSRPRRFGKSLLISTLENYYLGKKELFRGLAIEKLETEWKTYPVFHIDFNGINFTEGDALLRNLRGFVADQEDKYSIEHNPELELGDRFVKVLVTAHEQTGMRCVVLVDEYDKPLLDVMDTDYTVECGGEKISIEERNRNILKSFYSTFKRADSDLQFVFLTGVTKFSQISVFSGFNQPDDISLSVRYDTLCGITEEEMTGKLSAQIAEMAKAYGVEPDEMLVKLRKQYDGYHFSRRMKGVYNPFSILRAFNEMFMYNYWFKTGSPTYLVRLLERSHENIMELVGKYYPAESFDDYKADSQMPLPMIYQSGYLTIKEFKLKTNSYLLDFPNDEVKQGFITLLANNYLHSPTPPESWVTQVVDALDDGDTDTLKQLFTSFLASIPYSIRQKGEREKHFQYTFYLILRMISTYTVFAEKEQSEGRVDCVVETDKHVYIFEFKRDGSAEQAMKQIDTKGYACEFASDKRTIHKIGCNFSSETGTIDGWKAETVDNL